MDNNADSDAAQRVGTHVKLSLGFANVGCRRSIRRGPFDSIRVEEFVCES